MKCYFAGLVLVLASLTAAGPALTKPLGKNPLLQPLDNVDPLSFFPIGNSIIGKSMELTRSGKAYLLKGDYARAISDLDEAVRLNPKSGYALASRGVAYRMKGDYDRAMADFDKAICLQPKYGYAFVSRGVAYGIKGNNDRAISDFDEAIRLDTKNALALANRGVVYREKGDYTRAISDLDKAIQLDPKNALAFANRGDAYRMKSDYDHAIADFDEAIRLDPKNGLALAGRGDACLRKGDYNRAISHLDEAIRLDPEDGVALASRGEAYLRKGDYDRAIFDFDAAIRIDPKNRSAVVRRAEVLKLKGGLPSAATAATTPSAPAASPPAAVIAAPPSVSLATPPLGRRVALVIGNGSYRKMPALTNPVNDASDVGDELTRIGFDVQIEIDADRVRLNDAMSRFSGKVEGAEIALFYYAGHGMQFQGKNFLLPVDADLQSSADVNKFKLLAVDDVVDVLGSAGGLQLIVLDACRNNPAEQDFKAKAAAAVGASRDVSTDRGFARIDTPSGLLLVYATAPNRTAADGRGRNSPFTAAFLDNLKRPNLEVRQMLNRVQADVYRATEKKQLPEISSLYVGPDLVLTIGN
ncbi:tetratricopeptide repeat protein [Bradyrhizobium cenepequi]